MKVVISQPMYFPWVGMLEQLKIADKFIFLDNVQLANRSFTNRVQVKTRKGVSWMTIPLHGFKRGQLISEVKVKPQQDWASRHINLINTNLKTAPFKDHAVALMSDVFAQEFTNLSSLASNSLIKLADYFNLLSGTQILYASSLNVGGSKSELILNLAKMVGATTYITGHGAKNYLNHEIFEEAGIKVEYMAYLRQPYSQDFGEFTPYVTALDLVANRGKDGIENIRSATKSWRDFI